MAKGDKNNGTGLIPPDLSSVQISLLHDPSGDAPPPVIKFGDIKLDVRGDSFEKGINATFWRANPRNDLLTEGTFAVVEMLQGGRWVPAYDDYDFCLYFKWDGPFFGPSPYDLGVLQ